MKVITVLFRDDWDGCLLIFFTSGDGRKTNIICALANKQKSRLKRPIPLKKGLYQRGVCTAEGGRKFDVGHFLEVMMKVITVLFRDTWDGCLSIFFTSDDGRKTNIICALANKQKIKVEATNTPKKRFVSAILFFTVTTSSPTQICSNYSRL